jgi:transcriptional regulator with XRE-family HTH domain
MKESSSKDIGSRIKELIFKLELNQTSFAKAVGVSHTAIFKTVSGETQPRLVLIDAILNTYPQVSRDWLLEGKGEMFNNAPAATVADTPDGYLQNHLMKLEKQFAEMAEMFRNQLAVKDRQIEKLMDLLGKLNDVAEEAQTLPLWGEEIMARA